MNSASSCPVSSNAETSASQTSTRPFSLSRDFFHSLTGRLPRNRGRFLPTPRIDAADGELARPPRLHHVVDEDRAVERLAREVHVDHDLRLLVCRARLHRLVEGLGHGHAVGHLDLDDRGKKERGGCHQTLSAVLLQGSLPASSEGVVISAGTGSPSIWSAVGATAESFASGVRRTPAASFAT